MTNNRKLGSVVYDDVSEETESWARALCVAFGAKPDKLVGDPPAPRWRGWIPYAELSMKAASMLKDREEKVG